MNEMKTTNVKHFISYLVVGSIATLVEWGAYYCFDPVMHINTYTSVALAFVVSTFANWVAGRLMTYRNAAKQSLWKEIASIYGAAVIGLGLNELIMLFLLNVIMTSQTSTDKMISKVTATAIVFFWNYLIREFYIYKNDSKKNNNR
jgi:Predicted membrane protein